MIDSNSENLEIQISAYNVAVQMILVVEEQTTTYRSRLFSFLLAIQSIPDLPLAFKVSQMCFGVINYVVRKRSTLLWRILPSSMVSVI